ncbi:hypothetical protein RCL_jg7925.t1 [Rhizophagus clarus]|uniref:Uncharacterized protein n=1 Tax=Rhizophagus clarus TaxID=94130 RepID=A0A8H3MFR8_9GLOM|nr:hypothetical protein RCL_jg7925.t1 [Rhizophagus clarus]
MNFNEQFEDDLYVAELSRNLSMPDDNDDEQDDNNIEETQVEETQVEENVRSRGRGRGRGRGVSRDVGERDEQNIKRYMHISDCTTPLTFWYSKVEPLATHIRTVSQSICIPSSNVSIDVMWHCVVIRIEVIAL